MAQSIWKCPHCGNTDVNLMHDNGRPVWAYDLTLLCVARVPVADSTHERDWLEEAGEIERDAAGNEVAPCAMQWDPNDGDYDDEGDDE